MSVLLSDLKDVFRQARDGTLVEADIFEDFDLRDRSPNAIEWVTKPEYLNKPSLYIHVRQYQVIRDFFQLRCPLCNPEEPDAVNCWGKSRDYLESELLLVWSKSHQDDVCPKCRNTRKDFVHDGLLNQFNTMIGVAGMRSGKSVAVGQIATYVDHIIVTLGVKSRGHLQKICQQLETQTFEVGFAATTATQTEATVYDVYRELRAASPWMQKYVKWVKDRQEKQIVIPGMQPWVYKELDSEIVDEYLRIKWEALNKNSAGLAGRTRLAIFIDELARFGTQDSAMGAHEVWQVLHNSLKTLRKAKDLNPELPWWLGLAVSCSSPISIEDKQMQLLAASSRVPSMFSFHYATWEFNPYLTREDFNEDYAVDPVLAERDFAARPPAASNPLVEDTKRFWQAIDWDLVPSAVFLKTNPVDKTGREYVGLTVESAQIDRRFERFIRVDAGLSFDSFSIACAHGEWVPNVRHLTADSLESMDKNHYDKMVSDGYYLMAEGNPDGDYPAVGNELQHGGYYVKPNLAVPDRSDTIYVTVFDWVVRILPEINPKKTVWFESIVSIVRKLKQYYQLNQVIFDHWNSEAPIQAIREMGVESDKQSLKTDDFLKFRNDIYAGRCKLLPPLKSDSLELSEDGAILAGSKMPSMSGQGCGILEILKLERSLDMRKIANPHKGKVVGENSDDLAQTMVGVHRQVQAYIYSKPTANRENLKREKLGGQRWDQRGGIFRLSRWT